LTVAHADLTLMVLRAQAKAAEEDIAEAMVAALVLVVAEAVENGIKKEVMEESLTPTLSFAGTWASTPKNT